MSTDLYGIRILKVEPKKRKVTLRVLVVYYDTDFYTNDNKPLSLPTDASFFLDSLRSSWRIKKKPNFLKEVITNDQILDDEWLYENTYKYITRLKQICTKNKGLSNYNHLANFYSLLGRERWVDEEKLVQGDYEVTFSDEKYLSHLEAGQAWGTTAFDRKSIYINTDYFSVLPNLSNPIQTLVPFHGKEEEATPRTAIFSADGSKLIAYSDEYELVAYEVGTWQEVWRTKERNGSAFCYFYLNQEENTVWSRNSKWDCETGKTVTYEPKEVYGLKNYSPLGNYALCIFEGGEIIVEGIIEATEDQELYIVGDRFMFGVFSDDEQYFLWADECDKTEIYRMKDMTLVMSLNVYCSEATFDPTGRFVAIKSHRLLIYDLETQELIFAQPDGRKKEGDYLQTSRFHENYQFFNSVAWSPDSKYFVITLNGDKSIPNNMLHFGGAIMVYEVGRSE